ncbi:probable E3 ubiquitin-protein ligase XBOS32 [Rhodamnia argentea]|uniref:RING-type E3 ubiquitin transferase n=1 Tax=Rhodamnia argentea TaxID=178133 RepID=A0A8B8PLJ5_9MYRT|nr:probable E3 ubiquitin-protein ligase XBOS32 [Rhodamnia argentea]
MRLPDLVSNSFRCSVYGERLVSAARDGDLPEAKALLECNPRLVRYSTLGVHNSPLHYAAAQGHHEIVSLLLESGVDINLRNYRGQTALMQACQHGHWEVVQILVLSRADIHRADYINGGTALHLAALNGHSLCIRLLLVDYIPSTQDLFNAMRGKSENLESITEFDQGALCEVVNRAADGGITALHMASLNGNFESVQLLLDFGASHSVVTEDDGTTMDIIGAGSTPLHYAACGGSERCCQILIGHGASLTAVNSNGWTPLMIARSWHKNWLTEILSRQPDGLLETPPSPYISLPLMSIVNIARECGWKSSNLHATYQETCVVCLERKCSVAAEGCGHQFCTRCALYLCSTTSSSVIVHGPPGSIACPLCRHGIVSFVKLPGTRPVDREIVNASPSLAFCTCYGAGPEKTYLENRYRKPISHGMLISLLRSSFRALSFRKLYTMKIDPRLCLGAPSTSPLDPFSVDRKLQNHLSRCWRSALRRSGYRSVSRGTWFSAFNQCVAATE